MTIGEIGIRPHGKHDGLSDKGEIGENVMGFTTERHGSSSLFGGLENGAAKDRVLEEGRASGGEGCSGRAQATDDDSCIDIKGKERRPVRK